MDNIWINPYMGIPQPTEYIHPFTGQVGILSPGYLFGSQEPLVFVPYHPPLFAYQPHLFDVGQPIPPDLQQQPPPQAHQQPQPQPQPQSPSWVQIQQQEPRPEEEELPIPVQLEPAQPTPALLNPDVADVQSPRFCDHSSTRSSPTFVYSKTLTQAQVINQLLFTILWSDGSRYSLGCHGLGYWAQVTNLLLEGEHTEWDGSVLFAVAEGILRDDFDDIFPVELSAMRNCIARALNRNREVHYYGDNQGTVDYINNRKAKMGKLDESIKKKLKVAKERNTPQDEKVINFKKAGMKIQNQKILKEIFALPVKIVAHHVARKKNSRADALADIYAGLRYPGKHDFREEIEKNGLDAAVWKMGDANKSKKLGKRVPKDENHKQKKQRK